MQLRKKLGSRQRVFNCQKRLFKKFLFRFAFPECDNLPSICNQLCFRFTIICSICLNLIKPPFSTGLRNYVIPASFMSMPEATMYEDNSFIFWEYNIRLSGKVFYMKAVPETLAVQKPPNQQFRFGILTTDPGHVVRPGFFRMNVH